MKFYGIDSEGRLRLPHISVLPTYDYTKHKRLVICQDLDDTIYVGTGDADGFWMALADSDEVISDTAEAINIHDEDESAHSFILNKLDTDLSAHDALATAHAPIRAEIDSDIATHDALVTAHAPIRAEIDSDIATHDGDATAHPAIRAEIDSDITTHNANPEAHGLDNLFSVFDELITTQSDREFNDVNHWGEGDIDSFSSSGALSLTAAASGQYCELDSLHATTIIDSAYALRFTVLNINSTWTIQSFDGAQDYGVITTNGQQQLTFEAETVGGIRIVSNESDSSGVFDSFSLKSREDWTSTINSKIDIHNTSTSAHSYQHEQSSPSSTWTITHNLNKRPLNVVVCDTDYKQITPKTITYTSENVIELSFGETSIDGYANVSI